MHASPPPPRWDIFCTVVDNYGDIGVCWRLAQQLFAEYGIAVRLWVDDLAAFARLCPDIDPGGDHQECAGISVRRWPTPFPEVADTADVVVEAFACELPENYVFAMAERRQPPCWINLEYLSAEAWVAECNGLPSPHPRLPLTKYFLIPGFDEKSAGLLRECDLIRRHDTFDKEAWWRRQGIRPCAGRLHVSLFAYENRAVGNLFDAWRRSEHPVLCLATDSRILTSVSAALGRPLLPGDTQCAGNLEVHVQPFMRQEAYDSLLAACDLNFVRGEDSLVRAIWVGKPFVWHIYPQDGEAHRVKLDAFLDRYCADLSVATATALREFWHAWNAETATAEQWQAYADYFPAIAEHARGWREKLAQLPDLAKTLVDFCRDRL